MCLFINNDHIGELLNMKEKTADFFSHLRIVQKTTESSCNLLLVSIYRLGYPDFLRFHINVK